MFVLNDTHIDPRDIFARLDQALIQPAGHRYGIHMSDTAMVMATLLYLRDRGAGVYPLHPDTPADTARVMAQRAGCDILLTDDLQQVAIAQPAPVEPGVLVQMTSGTTGAAKVTTRHWDEWNADVASYADFFTASAGMTPVVACPVTHTYGMVSGVMVALHRGIEPVILDSLNPKYILRRMREVNNPLLYTSPAMLHTVARFLPKGERLHAAMTSGTILPESWFSLIRERTTHFFQQYGCSETGCITINQDLQDAFEVGHALPHIGLTAGSATEPAPIMVRNGPRFANTGDLGCLAPDGMLTFTARADDMINVAGLNVYPQEVERCVMNLEGVIDAVAFRIEDAHAGDRVGLIYSGPGVDPDALRDHCKTQLAGFQLPTMIRHVSAVPRQANGKISRRQVAADFARTRQEAQA